MTPLWLALLLGLPLSAADRKADIPIVVLPIITPTVSGSVAPVLDTKLTAPALAEVKSGVPTASVAGVHKQALPIPAAANSGAQAGAQGKSKGEEAVPPQLDGGGKAALSANAAAVSSVEAGKTGSATEAGKVFDLSGGVPGRSLRAVPVSAAELSVGNRSGLFASKPSDAARLSRLAVETVELRRKRAEQGEASLSLQDAGVLRGIEDIARMVELGRSTPKQLDAAAKLVSKMDVAKLKKFSELASNFIQTDTPKSSPFARVGNVEHVSQQLIDPLAMDGAELAAAFKTNSNESDEHFVEALKALQYATDTGKQQNPDDIAAALARFNPQADTGPNWYINNFILPHEYASMKWAESMGRDAGFTPIEILAFQRLIANHNFGPDLTQKRNAVMREHWWAKNFREQMLPMLSAMGVDTGALFRRDETGALQYNNTQGHRYPLLLSVYDRAIAVKANGNGLATWRKYGVQDYNGKKGRLKAIREANAKKGPSEPLVPDPEGAKDSAGAAGAIFEFDGPAVIKAMESTADWARQHVESLWGSLYASQPAGSKLKRRYPTLEQFRAYPPFAAHRESIVALNEVLAMVKASNPEAMPGRLELQPGAGLAYYEGTGQLPGLFRIVLTRTGPGAFNPRSADYAYAARIEVRTGDGWSLPVGLPVAVDGPDPVALYLDLIRRDLGW